MPNVRLFASLLAVLGLVACSSNSPAPITGGNLTVTAIPATAAADGVSTIAITVSGAKTGPVSVSTTRGTFVESGGKAFQTASTGTFTLTLQSCNVNPDATCAGSTAVRAADSSGLVGTAYVTFTGGGGGTDGGPDGGVVGCATCGDSSCWPVGNNPGKACDSTGHTCSPPINGISTCNICTPPDGGTAQVSELNCGDNVDNDCNGFIDCQDAACDGQSCSATGKICVANRCVCTGPEAATGETSCADGIDNDCNGLIDCADPNCKPNPSAPKGRPCGANGLTCSSAGTCACSGNGGVAQTTETSCGDGFDNDCDGLIDCADPDCSGKSCDSGGSVGKVCNGGVCQCPGGSVEICNDGKDNDCNGKTDCMDPTCQPVGGGTGQVCDNKGNTCSPVVGGVSSCSVCGGNGGTAQPGKETSCSDGFDNDCDGLVDCADPDCLNQPCNPLDPSLKCLNDGTGKIACISVVGQYSLTLQAASTRIAADGAATTTITATLRGPAGAVIGAPIAFTSSAAGSALTTPANTDASGQTTVTFTSDAAGGTAVVTAKYTISAGPPPVQVAGTVSISMPQLGQVNLLSQQYQILGVRSSGFQETSLLTFQLLDTANSAYPPGLTVAFAQDSLGGSYIGASANCSSGTPSTCTASAVTDSKGQVSVLLTSGRTAGVVQVAAGATAGGLSASGVASNIAIVGAKSSGLHITLDCNPKNVPALTNQDCNFSHYAGPGSIVTCQVALADRFNNALGISTLATFYGEAGSVGPPASTPMYDPKQPPGQQTGLGFASTYVAVNGGKLPLDVTPFDTVPPGNGEYSYTYTDKCGTLVHNPRDGLVTIIVLANGEEGFVDSNGNGVYDAGEPFLDMGEPYIDANDNGKYDPGEYFVDLNKNGVYDGPNGVWDANTVIWAETRILYTGFPYVFMASGDDTASRFYDSGAPPDPTLPPTFHVKGATPGPASTQTFGVYFADENFNQVTSSTAYSIAALGTGIVTVKYQIPPNAVDNLNMTFTQQYCDKPAPPATCGNVCSSSPCYVVTNVGNCSPTACSGFAYGNFGQVAVTGVGAGTDTVQAVATINSVGTAIYMGGDTYPCDSAIPPVLTYCSSTCVNTRTDAKNCGTCGNACVTGQSCVASACVCPPGQTVCGTGTSAACTNTQTDANNCNGCGIKCGGATPNCVAGVCSP